MGPGAGLDECRKYGPQRDAISRPFSPQRVATPYALSQPPISMLNLLNYGHLSSGIPPRSLVHINRRFTEICGRYSRQQALLENRCVCVCVYVCMYVYIYIYTHTHTHTYIYIYM